MTDRYRHLLEGHQQEAGGILATYLDAVDVALACRLAEQGCPHDLIPRII